MHNFNVIIIIINDKTKTSQKKVIVINRIAVKGVK